MNYRDFYKSNKNWKNVAEAMEEKELLKGINLENNACDDGLPKRPDGSLDTVHDGRPIHLSKIIQVGRSFGAQPASGELHGYSAMTTDGEGDVGAMGEPKCDQKDSGGSNASQPGDKETMLAGGKEFDSSIAAKSTGGPVVPGKGQEQGGPNTKGSIAGTSDIGGKVGDGDAENLTLQEAKARLHAIVKEVLKEITFNKSTGKWVKKPINEGHDAAGFPDGSVPGRPQYKISNPQYRDVNDARARTVQYDPEITEMHDEEEECMMNERYVQLMNAQRNLSEAELSELRDLGTKLERINEINQNQEEHEHTEVDLVNVIKKAVDKLGGMHKEDKPVDENTVNMKMGASYKVVQKDLTHTAAKDKARTRQYDPEISEAGGAAEQHSSFRTANDARQFPKNRHRGDIDEGN